MATLLGIPPLFRLALPTGPYPRPPPVGPKALGPAGLFWRTKANPSAGGRVRIESVQNAADQAKCVAAAIVGRSETYRAVPWFWTDQFDVKLQMAGLSHGYDNVVTRGEPDSRKFSAFYFRDGRLAAVDSVNRPGDHLAGRKLIGAGTPITPEQSADLSVDLKALTATFV